MKISFHVQPQQYEFIGFEYDSDEGLSQEAILAAVDDFNRAKRQISGKTGLPEPEFRQFIDNQLSGKGLSVEAYEKMNDYQIFAVQVLKRAKKRN